MTDIANPKILKMLKASGWLKTGKAKNDQQNDQSSPGKSAESNQASNNSQKFTCAVCGMPTLTCCSICKSTFYCSAGHQKLHWPKHKPECFSPEESASSQRNGVVMSSNMNRASTTVPKNLSDSGVSFNSQSQLERNAVNSAQKSQDGTQRRNSTLNPIASKEDIFGNRLGTGASIQEIESEESESSREEALESAYEMQISELAKQVAQMPESHDNNTSFGSKNKFLRNNNQMSFDAANTQNMQKNLDRDKGHDLNADNKTVHTKTEAPLSEETNEALLEDRRKLLRDILKNMSQNQLEPAVLKCKKLVKVSDKIFHQMENQDFKLVCADYLLFARCLIKLDRIQEARNELLDLKRFVIEHISDTKIDYRKGRESDRISVRLMSTKKEFLNFLTDESITMSKKKATLEILKDRTNIFSTLASLFYNIGDWNSCEDMYVKYTKITENNFGEDSFEAGDCYFVIGVFYLQHVC